MLAAVHDEEITYASANKDFTPPGIYQDRNPLLEPIVVHTDFAAQVSFRLVYWCPICLFVQGVSYTQDLPNLTFHPVSVSEI